MPKYVVTHDIVKHDGHAYERGTTIDVDQATGDALVEIGALQPVAEKPARGRGKAADAGESATAES